MVRLWEYGEDLEGRTLRSSSKAKDLSSLRSLCSTIRKQILDHQRTIHDQDQLIRTSVLLPSATGREAPQHAA